MTTTYLIAYIATLFFFLALDSIWLGTMASRLYRPALGGMMRKKVAIAPAVIFYPLFTAGLTYFAVAPGVAENSVTSALFNGAIVGLIGYGTYDLTNHATLKGWPAKLTPIDMIWGTVAAAAAAALAAAVTLWLV